MTTQLTVVTAKAYELEARVSIQQPLKKKRRRLQVKEVARERIDILVANTLKEKDENLAGRKAKLAKKMAMRFRLRLPYDVRQLYCKKCKAFIVPGRTARVRVGRAKTRAVRITCFRCGHIYRKILAAAE